MEDARSEARARGQVMQAPIQWSHVGEIFCKGLRLVYPHLTVEHGISAEHSMTEILAYDPDLGESGEVLAITIDNPNARRNLDVGKREFNRAMQAIKEWQDANDGKRYELGPAGNAPPSLACVHAES